MKISEKIINRIKTEQIEPISRWVFIGKYLLTWLFFVVSVLVGAAAFSVILFAVQQTDFELTVHLSHSRLELLLGLLPFFWIITLMVFLISAILGIQKTKKGYKYTLYQAVGFSTALSVLLGTLFFIGGGALWLDNTFDQRLTLYESIQDKKKQVWMKPEMGYLSGHIQSVEDHSFILIDFNNKKWEITYEDAFIPPVVILEKDEQIKLVGEITERNIFKANEIRPWGGDAHWKKMRNRMKKE